MREAILSNGEFARIQKMVHDLVGINLTPAKKPLICGRLAKRLSERQLSSYGEYFDLLLGGEEPSELQMALNLLTTNETYFFRESRHFEFLRDQVMPGVASRRSSFRVWSAASSSGEEAYSIAMLLADHLKEGPWEVFGSDISTRVLERAVLGRYPMERAADIPREYLLQYCLKGVRAQAGTFAIDRKLKDRVSFMQLNLLEPMPRLGEFDAIFLRNVMIYFDMETKRRVVAKLLPYLKPGGHFIIGHSENLNAVTDTVRTIVPSVYQKP